MNKRSVAIALSGLLIICLFITPVRFSEESYRIHYGSMFDSGHIDIGRFVLFVAVWIIAVFASQFADFGFLASEKATLFYKRLGSRIVDLLVVLLLVAVFGILFYFTDPSLFILELLLPTVFLLLWSLYFILFFRQGRTIGDQVFDLVQLGDEDNDISRSQLFIRELIYVFPIFLFALLLGLLMAFAPDYAEENDTALTVVAVALWLLFIIVDIVFPITSLFNKQQQGVVDIITKTRVRAGVGKKM